MRPAAHRADMAPVLITNPPDDVRFRDFAEASVGEPAETTRLQAIIRTRYPEAVVRARDLSGEQLTVWYVYRDGRWVA